MPKQQESTCKTRLSAIGGDVVYDTDCGTADHRLRLFACGDNYCGVYRYVPRRGTRGTGILEAIIFMQRDAQSC